MRPLLLVLLLSGCAYITDAEQDERYDPDGDGILWPDDCDDADADVSGPTSWYPDLDGDGFGGAEPVAACVAPADHIALSGDCDDARDDVFPGAEERCDGIDQDCDSTPDDDATDASVFYADDDADGFGDSAAPVRVCDQPDGYTSVGGDCDDSAADAFPGGTEVCDDGDVDQDCDGDADDLDDDVTGQTSWYADDDFDGYGAEGVGVTACDGPPGWVADDTDCDDAVAGTNPGMAELCDGLLADEDCDGLVNEEDPDATGLATYYADSDADTYGNAAASLDSCSPPSGYVATATDCDDASAAAYPGAPEYCDSVDTDCDGTLDEADALDATAWHVDGDGDGYGHPTSTIVQCAAGPGAVADATDCNDAAAGIYPGAAETWYDGVDQDCADDDDYDQDGDGYASSAWGGTDCDDTNAAVYPGRVITVPGSASSVQAGIDLACAGDVVSVGAGTWTGAVAFGTKAVTVQGAGDSTVLAGSGSGAVVTMSAGTLEAVRVTGGVSSGSGGGIAITATSAVTVRSVTVDGSSAASGGGIGISGTGAVTIESVTLSGNFASGAGGGLYATDTPDLELYDLLIDGNSASRGGGAHLDTVAGLADGLWIEGNDSLTCAGIEVLGLLLTSPWTLSDSTVTANTATTSDGGVCLSGEGATVEAVAVFDSAGPGAGFHVLGGLDATGLLVAGSDGDGLLLDPVSTAVQIDVVSATVVGNAGDGVACEPRKPNQVTLTNTIISDNGGYGVLDASSSRDPNVAYSSVYSNSSGAYSGMTSATGSSGNVETNPKFITWSDAMPTATADFHLRSSSALRNKGDPAIFDSDGTASDMGFYGGPTADADWYDDVDGDGLPDGWERDGGLNPASTDDAGADSDADGWTNTAEFAAGTEPLSADTDGDGVLDSVDGDPLDPTAP